MNYKHVYWSLIISVIFLGFYFIPKVNSGKIGVMYPETVELIKCKELCSKYDSQGPMQKNFSYGSLVLTKTHSGIIWTCECNF